MRISFFLSEQSSDTYLAAFLCLSASSSLCNLKKCMSFAKGLWLFTVSNWSNFVVAVGICMAEGIWNLKKATNVRIFHPVSHSHHTPDIKNELTFLCTHSDYSNTLRAGNDSSQVGGIALKLKSAFLVRFCNSVNQFSLSESSFMKKTKITEICYSCL